MKFQYIFFTLLVLSLAITSKADLSDLFNSLGDEIQAVWNNVIERLQNLGIDIGETVNQIISTIVSSAALPDGAAEIGQVINSLLEQAQLLEEQSNFTLHKVEIMDAFNQVHMDQLCGPCQSFIADLQDWSDRDLTDDEYEQTAEQAFLEIFFVICQAHFNETFCSDAMRDLITGIYSAINAPNVNSTWACQRLAMCPYLINNETLDPYVQDVLQGKPATTSIPVSANRSTYQVLHMTDIHIDFQYQEGTWARCGGFQCCRAENGASPNPDDPLETAGYWGGLGVCDLPSRTYEQFLNFVSSNFNFSFILWTGDNIDHEVWAQTQATQLDPTQNATAYLQQYFPNTTIYPMFGNHENFFSDQYDTTGNADDWVKTELGTIWQSLFSQDTLNEFTMNAYYSVVNEEHNLKVISLNMQSCDTLNFELIKDSNVDPLNQLAWLRNELLDAEANNLTVFIFGHIPPGDLNCDAQWSARYRALVDRFTNTIRGQFFGHTHVDNFQVVRSYSEGNPPVGVLFMTPSLSTYTELNPSFRIYEIDSETNEIVDYKQYRLDLLKWNQNTTGPLEWDLAYSFLEEYGLNDTRPESMDILADRIRTDNATTETYISNYYSGVEQTFDINNRTIDYYYCYAKNSQPHDIVNCLGLDPAKTNLLYFAGEFVPGMLNETTTSE